MFWAIITLTLLLSVILIVMVLLQPSKGGGLGGAFGGLGSSLGSTFGSRRTLDFLAKGTTYVAIGIGVLCLLANLFFIPSTDANSLNPVTTGATPTPTSTSPVLPLDQNSNSAPAAQGSGDVPGAGSEQTAPPPADGE